MLFLQDEGWKEYDWHAERIDTVHDHGTGCTLSAAIATGLAEGMTLPDAIVGLAPSSAQRCWPPPASAPATAQWVTHR